MQKKICIFISEMANQYLQLQCWEKNQYIYIRHDNSIVQNREKNQYIYIRYSKSEGLALSLDLKESWGFKDSSYQPNH